jgi:hypothetical protein
MMISLILGLVLIRLCGGMPILLQEPCQVAKAADFRAKC